jgi:hypothetical protein
MNLCNITLTSTATEYGKSITMPKAVSFAAVLDPALLLKRERGGDEGQKSNTKTSNEKKRGEEKGSTSRKSSDCQSGQISTNDSTTEEIIERICNNKKGKGRAKSISNRTALVLDSVNHKRTSAKLRMAIAGESPILQRISSISPGPSTNADITESIHDFSTSSRPLMRTISAPSAMQQPSPSSSKQGNSLAHSLASEEAKKRKNTEEHSKRQWNDVKRRTLYGSERRKLERQSRRMARNPKAKMMQNMSESNIIRSPSELRQKGSFIAPTLSQNDLELFKEDAEPAVFSQQSNFSVESDDGVYQTQFSFFHFDSEEHGEEENAQSLQPVQQTQEKDNIYSESLESSGVQTQTQAAYYADRSASGSLSDPQSSSTINPKDVESSSHFQQAIITSDSAPPLLNHNTTVEVPELPTSALVEHKDFFTDRSEADRKRLRALCLDENPDNHKIRRVHPTIWHGQTMVKGE